MLWEFFGIISFDYFGVISSPVRDINMNKDIYLFCFEFQVIRAVTLAECLRIKRLPEKSILKKQK